MLGQRQQQPTFEPASQEQQCSSFADGSSTSSIYSPTKPPVEYIFDNVFLAGGQFGPLINRIYVALSSWENIEETFYLIIKALHPIDILIFIVAAFLSIPTFGYVYNNWFSTTEERNKHPYHQSYVYSFAKLISQAAKIAIIVYTIDCCILIAINLGLYDFKLEKLSHATAKILYIAWLAQRFAMFKKYLLGKSFSRHPDKLGRISIVDRLIDGAIFICTGFVLLDILDMELGAGIKSMFALGSASTLVIGLASRDLAAMFVNGLALSTSNRFNEGDDIRFGDGTTGKIIKVGWIHTIIQNYDNLIEVVPNSELGMQRVKNLSRIKQCRVQQTLRFKYDDVDKLPQILQDIVTEIKSNCAPHVIVDGSKPLRAVWTDYREDHLKVVVTAHFNCKPIGQEYYDIQQKCLFAISNAIMKKNKVKLATTFYPHASEE